ncbi:NAD(P)-dependent oxidoreductase [Caballeronia sp. J97]|uniref:NAD-dependent epimerase/dehydratase family protein n=1 Tax=Caballeronia sp. J97 TaxID=2805429 RepID=UPI002AB03411|nr:NAD(P)-dependent oxidoreductase [Caballeronia sp. J97]
MNVLVTGGAGFLGAYLSNALQAAGHVVYTYDIASPPKELLHISPFLESNLRRGAIGDIDRLLTVCRSDKIDAVVHAAARVGLEPSLDDPGGFYQTNVMGLVNVCEVARQLGLGKVVFVSSNTACHAGVGAVQKETDPAFSITRANPSAHYGTSKMIGEAIGLSYADFHDLEFVALRVAAVYGFGMRIPLYIKPMVENSVAGRPTRFETGGRMKRDLTHVLDVSRAVALALDCPKIARGTSRVLNIAAGRLVSPAEIAEIVRRVVPGADIEIGNELTPIEEENLKSRVPLDVTLAREVLGWSPAWSIEEGIEEYAQRFRDSLKAI